MNPPKAERGTSPERPVPHSNSTFSIEEGRQRVTPEPWPEPDPIGVLSDDLPDWPAAVLGEPWDSFIDELSLERQTPRALAGMTVLSALSTAAGGMVDVQIRQHWVEPTCLYLLTVMRSGSGKTGVSGRVCKALHAAEHELIELTKTERRENGFRRQAAERKAADAAHTAIDDPNPENIRLAAEAAEALDHTPESVETRLLADDITPEALTSLLSRHGRIAVISAEGDVFGTMAGRYSRGDTNLSVFLKAHDAEPIQVDRVGRERETIDRPALTLGIAVQPVTLLKVAGDANLTGRGLMARFLIAAPSCIMGDRNMSPPPMPELTGKRFDEGLMGLVLMCALLEKPATVQFDDEALGVLIEFKERLEPRLKGDLSHMTAWASKLAGTVARIAALRSLALGKGIGPVSVDSVRCSVDLAEQFLLPHAMSAFGLSGINERTSDALKVLEWIRKQGAPSFTKREAHQALKGTFRFVAELEPGLEVLEDHGFIRELTPPPSRGRKSVAYEVYPHLLNPQNSQKGGF